MFAPGLLDFVETTGIMVLLISPSPILAAVLGWLTTAKWLFGLGALAALLQALAQLRRGGASSS